jgi:hypothetical protein
MLLQKFNQQLDLAREALALTTQHLDFIDLRLVLNLLAGSHGELGITISDILAQAPLSLWAALPADMSFGFESPVPFLTTVRPQSDGGINIEVMPCCSSLAGSHLTSPLPLPPSLPLSLPRSCCIVEVKIFNKEQLSSNGKMMLAERSRPRPPPLLRFQLRRSQSRLKTQLGR